MAERCIKWFVQTVVWKLKFPSNQTAADPFIVGNVIRNTDQKEVDTENPLYAIF